ncbi:unnamed protein product, partial [Rhizoctonia solani]
VQVWGVKDGSPICAPLEGHQDGVRSVAFSPDGASIVSGSGDSTVRVWKAPRHAVESRPSEANSLSSGDRGPHSAIAGGLTISSDGWARNGDSQLLFWVPPNMSTSISRRGVASVLLGLGLKLKVVNVIASWTYVYTSIWIDLKVNTSGCN